ncbi:MAG: hypothetical protein IT314_14020 [Anaerolineales bacterium]|nr:hypothetical protein [Anaerolineales bacterium]
MNPVKHGLVKNAEEYPFCSYNWFLEKADRDFREAVMNQPMDRIDIEDDFDEFGD